MRSVVAVCGDPGGANAVAPVLKLLAHQARVAVQAFAYNEARSLWAEQGIAFVDLPSDITGSAIINTLSETSVGLLLTGTSMNSVELEKQFIAASHEVGLPSLAVLDFWSNYKSRFSDQNGNLVYLPDRIAIMDEDAGTEMVREGIDASLLTVTGQPAFDDLASYRKAFTGERRTQLRHELKSGSDDLVVLFASQPLARLYGADATNPLYLGYDERKVLTMLIAALERIAERVARPITLVIRPHPRESSDTFAVYRSDVVRISISTNEPARDVAMAVDLVTGMNTNLLVEACYLGCIVVSLQPGLCRPDVLPTNRSGLSRPVYRDEDIEPMLAELLIDGEARAAASARLAEHHFDGGAAQRVAALAYRMIGLEV
jgi:hypothetical protein